MKTANTKREQTEKLALMALLTALTAVLAYFGGFIRIGGLASVNLTLIPVVLGAALYGPAAGAWLGGVAGVIFFTTADAAGWLAWSVHGTIITVMVKSILSGFCAGLVFKLIDKLNRYAAVIVSAIVCPVVNTGTFLLGCLIFFRDPLSKLAGDEGMTLGAYFIFAFVTINFVFEVLANIVLSPTIFSLLNIRKKK